MVTRPTPKMRTAPAAHPRRDSRVCHEDEVAACPSYTGDWDGTKFCRDGWPSGEADALRMAQQLMLTTAEFHAASTNPLRGDVRAAAPPSPSLGRPYKAIIVLFLGGGADSYSVPSPHVLSGRHTRSDHGVARRDSYWPGMHVVSGWHTRSVV